MKTVGKEEYELPLFDNQLLRLTYSPDGRFSESENQHTDIESGELHLKETVPSTGKGSISVIHKDDGENVGRYRFKIIDQDQRICRYTGSNGPPWSIYCAVTEYGYHCQTVPQSERKHAFDLLDAGALELLQKIQQIEYQYPVGWGLRVFEKLWLFIRMAALEYQIGAENMEEFVSNLEGQLDNDPLSSMIENIEQAFETYNVENPFIPNSLRHPSTGSFLETDGSKDNETRQHSDGEQSEKENRVWKVATHRGRGDSADILYASIIGSDAIERFSFQISDEEAGECVAQTNVVGDLPPYTVIESVREQFEITNLPSFVYGKKDVPFSQFLIDLDRIVRQATKQVAPESTPTETILDDYISSLDVYLVIVAAYETAPEEYNQGIREVFSKLGIDLSTQNIGKLSHSDLDQMTSVAFQAVDDADEIKEFARELLATANTEERRRVDITEDPDVSLAAELYDKDVGLYK
jgi:hypothetical protein